MFLAFGENHFKASGWVAASRAFITAGHCVFEPKYGGWITKASFCPCYDNKCTKRYTGTVAYTLKGWVEDKDYAYDIAACLIDGYFATTEPPLGFYSTLFKPKQIVAIGYPKTPIPKHQFNGERMWQSVGASVSQEHGIIVAANNLTDGASGGPWCVPDGNYHVCGLNSPRTSDANQLASPLFWISIQKLYEAVLEDLG
jgi:V8-like Glu-specific endopeptidase